jgi:hypothetical protein
LRSTHSGSASRADFAKVAVSRSIPKPGVNNEFHGTGPALGEGTEVRLLRIAASLLVLVLLQSCGGGGGGGSSNSNSSFSITLDRTSIAFEAFEGGFAPTQNILATARGEYDGDTLFVGATVEGPGIDPTIEILILSDTQARIAVNAAPGLSAGTYSGRIIFHACRTRFAPGTLAARRLR